MNNTIIPTTTNNTNQKRFDVGIADTALFAVIIASDFGKSILLSNALFKYVGMIA